MGLLSRRLRKRLAVALLLLLPGLADGVVSVHSGGDDLSCLPVSAAAHDPAAHRIVPAVRGTISHDHCFICHTLRSVRPAETARRGPHPEVPPTAWLEPAPFALKIRLAAADVPARAPPA